MKLTNKEKQLVKEYAKKLVGKNLKEGLGTPERLSDENIDRMRGLVNQRYFKNYIDAAASIMKDFTEEGYEASEVFGFLWMELVNNV